MMSWEGYHQYICEEGHSFSGDAHDDVRDVECPACGALVKWFNVVNLTNGSFHGRKRIDGYVKLKVHKPAKTKTCRHCKQSRLLSPTTYIIPKGKGHLVER